MIFRDAGKQLAEDRRGDSGESLHDTASLADLHDAEPERQDAGQADGDLESGLGRVERGVDNIREDLCIAPDNQTAGGHHESDQEEGDPDVVQYHVFRMLACLSGKNSD